MLWDIYTAVIFVLLIVLGVWASKKVLGSNRRWDAAYIARYNDLRASLPLSDVFPAVLHNIDFPRVGSGSALNNSRDSLGILYLRNGLVVLELVGSQAKQPFYKVYPLINAPASELFFKDSEPEANFPGKDSYVLQTADNSKMHLIGQFVATPMDIATDADILKLRKSPEGQQKIITELLHSGVTVRVS